MFKSGEDHPEDLEDVEELRLCLEAPRTQQETIEVRFTNFHEVGLFFLKIPLCLCIFDFSIDKGSRKKCDQTTKKLVLQLP